MAQPTARQAGFTIIELLIVLGLSTVLVLGFSALFFSQMRFHNTERALLQQRTDLRLALTRIHQLLEPALSIETSATVDGTLYTSGENTLVATLPSVAVAATVIEGSTDTIVIQRLPDGVIEALIEPSLDSARSAGSQTILGQSTSLSFSYPAAISDSKAVTVGIAVSAIVNTQAVEFSDSTIINFKNKQ